MPRISKRLVDTAAPDATGRRVMIWDSEVKGFGLLVLPSGVKSYVYNYRTPEGRARRYTIGKHGDYTAEKARDKAEDLREAVRHGRDPLGEKAAAREALTVNDLLDSYLASEKFKDKADSTRAIDEGRIRRHLRPLLGRAHIEKLRTEDIRKALVAIRDGKTAKKIKTKPRGVARVRGGATTARDTIALLRAIFNWGIAEGIIKSNPAKGIKLVERGSRDTILENAHDYARLFSTLQTMEAEKHIKSAAADAIRVIALTGARRGEIAGLRWGHVHLDRGEIIVPPSGHKTGKRTGKPRIIALPAAAQEIISRQPVGEPDDLVFGFAKGRNGAVALGKVWNSVRAKAELPDGLGLHGLRHSLASHLAMGGAGAAEIMAAMGHTQLSTAQRYVHWARDARHAVAERAAAVVIAGMAAASGGSGEVVELKKGRSE